MANVYPLGPQSYRPPDEPAFESGDVTVITNGDAGVTYDQTTNTTQVPLEDGSVEVTWGEQRQKRESKDFDDNLAELLSETELGPIAEKLLLGIEQDIQSRSAWLENMSAGISLLGLQVKIPRGAAATGATPAEGTSTVDHPLLLEAVLRFQANARGELLPSDGPVKVRNDGQGDALSDQLAEALEKDLNHYLTKVAKEYVPDTDRMLFMLGFCGISFKKGYHDPIKQRPVIRSIDAKDLIVSNAATDLDGARRVTHHIMMGPGTLRRMQLLGVYRDITLPATGMPENKNVVDTKIDQLQGIAPPSYIESEDQDRELYECYCEIDVPGFEHELDGKLTGLPLPYIVTIDKDARRILQIKRNWEEDDVFCLPRNRIVAYMFIPGLGFYGIGLLNVLGNATKAVTAAWRLLIDAGMFSNFPGFLYLKSLAKQLTNQFRVPPGGGMPIDTVGNDIRASIMPLPYQPPNPVFMQLIENVVQTAQRVGGTAETQIGEGKQDAPVGTTLALIEQQTKLMSAVHKRCHSAQGQELDMLKSLLMEDPAALWRHNKKSKVLEWLIAQHPNAQMMTNVEDGAELRHQELFLAALENFELVPRADPNTSSQTERYLKVMAMRQMAATNPSLDLDAIDRRAFQTLGIDDGDSLFKPPPPPGAAPPAPENVTAQATMIAAQARMQESQTSAAEAAAKAQLSQQQQTADIAAKQQEDATKERIANLQVARELVIHNAQQAATDAAQQKDQAAQQQSDQRDQQTQLKSQQMDQAHELRLQGLENNQKSADRIRDIALAHMANQSKANQAGADRLHGLVQTGVEHHHEAQQSALDRQHDLMTQPPLPPGGKGGVGP